MNDYEILSKAMKVANSSGKNHFLITTNFLNRCLSSVSDSDVKSHIYLIINKVIERNYKTYETYRGDDYLWSYKTSLKNQIANQQRASARMRLGIGI